MRRVVLNWLLQQLTNYLRHVSQHQNIPTKFPRNFKNWANTFLCPFPKVRNTIMSPAIVSNSTKNHEEDKLLFQVLTNKKMSALLLGGQGTEDSRMISLG